MYFFGIVFIITTALIYWFKNEQSEASLQDDESEIETNLSLYGSYKIIWKLLCMRSVREFCLIFLTARVSLK